MQPSYGRSDESANVPIGPLPKAPQTSGYRAFLKSHYWWTVCNRVRERDCNQCQSCKRTYSLQVHHITYEHHGDEANHLEDLITLCDFCHASAHDKNPRRGKAQFESLNSSFLNVLGQIGPNAASEGRGRQ